MFCGLFIKGGSEQDKEDDRKRKNIGIGENISFLLIGKPKGNIEEITWNIKGEGFQQTDTNPFKGSQQITLTAKKDLTKDARVTITAKTGEDKEAKITVNIRIPKKITKENMRDTWIWEMAFPPIRLILKYPRENTVSGDLLK